ncbi:hypothetical protein EI94DRAFT_1789471 [Lactarius quietus]|nr:hypothetical protein EI94DRAFT_1789471 [Lactarius quietus]
MCDQSAKRLAVKFSGLRKKFGDFREKAGSAIVWVKRGSTIPDAPEMIDVLSATLDASYAVGVVFIFIFFSLQYLGNGNIGQNSIQNWWGNTVYLNTADAKGTPLKTLSDGQTFGPKSW